MTAATREPAVLDRFRSRQEAEVVRQLLEAHGIRALVTSDDAGATAPALSMQHGVVVMVAAEDLDQAREILEASGAGGGEGLTEEPTGA